MIVAFVDENKAEFGVEFICKLLQVAPSSYYAAKKRQTVPSARAVRDAVMMQVLMTLWVANRKVYGAHKLWKAAQRAGHNIGRDQVARLMRELGIEGVSRLRKKVFTTKQDPDAARAPDLVNRQFTGPARCPLGDRPDRVRQPVVEHRQLARRAGQVRGGQDADAGTDRLMSELLAMVDAAQRAAGVLAARHRGDREGAAQLMASFPDAASMAGGSMLIAELALGMYQRESGQDMDACVQHLCLHLESRVSAVEDRRSDDL